MGTSPGTWARAMLRRAMKPAIYRPMPQWAEEEFVLPASTPVYGAAKYRLERQPAHRLLLEAIAHSGYREFVVIGPSQSGKTTVAFAIPLLWHLFERGQTVVAGVPDLALVNDLWRDRILPAIEATRYREFLPSSGEGTRGGSVESRVDFLNGAVLRFMTAGSNDKGRASFTAAALVVTEAEGFEFSSAKSREANKLAQLKARLRASHALGRSYIECTVTTEEGLAWQEYQAGTASRIAIPCPACQQLVCPEREHLVGWQDAEDEVSAIESGAIACPGCGVIWTEAQRIAANRAGVLIHAGQEIDESGNIAGTPKRTTTLGFRWNAANNCLVPVAEAAREEWLAARHPNRENEERKLCQFVWCRAFKPENQGESDMRATDILARVSSEPRGIIPSWATVLTAGIDLGKWLAHWTVMACSPAGRTHIVDFGQIEIPSNAMTIEAALMLGMREFGDLCAAGWATDTSGKRRSPALTFIDSGSWPDAVYQFATEQGPMFRAAKGVGVGQYDSGSGGTSGRGYHAPKTTGAVVVQIGDGWHLARLKASGVLLVEVNVDQWKGWVHDRIRTPPGQEGSLSLFAGEQRQLMPFARHLTAESRIEEFNPRKGMVVRWEARSKANHWGDATMLAAVAAGALGVRVTPRSQGAQVVARKSHQGRPASQPRKKVSGGWQRR